MNISKTFRGGVNEQIMRRPFYICFTRYDIRFKKYTDP